MSTIQDQPPVLGGYMAAVLQDKTKLKQFAKIMTGPDRLRSCAAGHDDDLSTEEAERVCAKAGAMLDASSGRAPIGDKMLDAVSGGISPAGVGAAIGGLGAAASLTIAFGRNMASPCTGGVTFAGITADIARQSGTASLSVGAEALAAGIGASGSHIIWNS